MSAEAHEPEDHLSLAAYLVMESRSEIRHEFVAGRVVAMAGGTRRHDLAATWLAAQFFAAFTPQGCAVFPHNRKLRVDRDLYYPDLFVHCGPPGHEQWETGARVIVEVLSPDSRLRDRRDKATAYSRVPGLEAYLVVDPDQPRIEVYAPEDGEWVWRVYGPGMKVPLRDAPVDVDTLYDYVQSLAGQ